ncbi:NAD-dependent epimerase/dehydratase family protein, partial [archaeon]|nr:NAD-dependent epimerase/dehydratase family protein [archaeon]
FDDALIREIIPTINFYGIVFIVNRQDVLVGIISGGDLRRAFINKINLDNEVNEIMNKKFISGTKKTSKEKLNNKAKELGYQSTIPLLDKKGKIVAIYKSTKRKKEKFDIEQNFLYSTPNENIFQVMKKIDISGEGISIVIKENKLFGIITDKNIRDAISQGISLNEPISKIVNKKPFVIHDKKTKEEIIKELKNCPIKGNIKIPVLDKNKKVIDIINAEKFKDEILILDNNKTKSVLITGGAGYLGSILARKLLGRGHKVRILDNLLYGNDSIKNLKNNPNFEFVKGDLKHIDVVAKAATGINAVVHLAGIVGDPACSISPKYTIEQNFLSTVNIANICKYNQINRFIFASSCSVYGHGNKILNENSKLNPVSLYARDKINSENGIMNLANDNFSPTIMRMGTLYGWSFRPRFDLVLNILTALAIRKGEFSIFGGDQWRPMLHVADAADAYVLAIEASTKKVGKQIFNIGSNDQNFKILDIGKIVNKIIPSKMNVDGKDFDKRDYRVNFDKISNVLKYKSSHSIEDGIKEIRDAMGSNFDYTNAKYNNFKFLKLKEDSFAENIK